MHDIRHNSIVYSPHLPYPVTPLMHKGLWLVIIDILGTMCWSARDVMLCREGDAGSQSQAWHFLDLKVWLHCITRVCLKSAVWNMVTTRRAQKVAGVGHACQLQSLPVSKDAMVGKCFPLSSPESQKLAKPNSQSQILWDRGSLTIYCWSFCWFWSRKK